MGKKLYRTRQNVTKSGGSGGATLKKFTAPTPGLEDVFFTWGTAKDAAKFEDTVSQLANYVGTRNWTKSSVASKAMSAIEAPVIAGPDRPVREYWEDLTRTVRTNNKTGGEVGTPVANEPVFEDWEHDLNVEEYKIKLRAFREQEAAWNENKAKCYYLVLSHCPKELETELRNNSKWEETESNQDMVALLLMIRDVTHNKKERKESVMTIVESDVELFTITQEANQTLDDYYKIFKAQVDTIDAHGGNAGHHPVVFQLHLAALLKKGGKTNDDYVAMSTSDQAGRAVIQSEALKTSKGAYLACLFLLMADERRFGGVKATLGDNFLLGKQEYPQDLLAAKRLLADFKGTGPISRKAAEPAPGQGVAFVEGGKKYVPNCYACGRKCQGGYKACKHITDEHRARVAKLAADGAFWKKKPSGNETKQGTVNVVAGDDDDDAGSEENATNTTSTTSELTEDKPSYEQLWNIAKLAGVVNANVGTPEPKKLEDYCEDDFSWDGDRLADMGVGFIECQNPELERHSTVKNEWKVQGRRGTNPVKAKTSSVKGPSLLKKGNPSGDRVSRKWGNRDVRIVGAGLNDDETASQRNHEIVKANPSHFFRADSPSEKPAWVVESCLRDKRGSRVASGKQVRIDECAQARSAGKDSPEPRITFKEKELRSVSAPSVEALPHSANKEFIDTNQAGAKPSLPGLERVKDANPDLLWGSPNENQASNGVVSVNNKGAQNVSEKKGRYTLDWYKCYLDSCATYHTFFIRKFLKNIGEDHSTMSGNCNAGTVLLRQKGWYKNFQVWLNDQGIVNLLSIPMLEEAGYKVSTHTDREWIVTTPKGEDIVFKRDTGVCKGMPYIDLRDHKEGAVMIETVEKNMDGFTKKEIERAKLVRAVQRRTGHPTDEHLKTIVSQQSLKNNPIRSADVANAKSLFGPHVAGLKGWSTRKRTKGFPGERVSIPNDFYRLNKFVTIAADVMFIAGVPFFVTYSKKIKFLSVEYLPRRTARQLANALRKVLFIYARGGFLVRQAMMDMEFEKIKDLVPLVEVNTTAAREHVGLIERTIRSVKEKVRATTSEFPFMYIPILVLIHTVYGSAFWINGFPLRSENFGFSPREIVTGLSTDYKRDCKCDPGSYVEASTDAIVTNDNTERTRSCVAVGPVGNRQGSVKCFDIETGKILHRRTVTQIPWPLDNILIRKVEAWGKKGARAIKRGRIEFLNRKGEKFDWDNDDLTDLEVVDEQPKLIDPGVADIPVPDEYDEEITASDEKERPSYVTRAVLARQRAGLDRESEPGAARGVGVLRADDVIVIDDDDDTIQGDYQSAFAPPLTIKVEEANIPVDSEVEQEGPRRSKRDRKQRVPFSPTVKGQYHKAVGFVEMEGSPGSDAPHLDDEFLSTGVDSKENQEVCPDVHKMQLNNVKLRYGDAVRSRRGINSHGNKDQGVLHPPKSRVKVDSEKIMVNGMYEGAGYNVTNGVIHIEVNKGAPQPRSMTEAECETHVVGLVLAQMYSLKKGTELFGERADEAVIKELSQVEEFETYQPMHKHELSEEDRKNALESMMKVTEKREDEVGNRKIKGRLVADGSKQRSYEGYEKSDGSSPTARTDSVILTGVIDAHERRAVSIIDVENAFLQSENDQRIIMAIRGKTAELLVRMKPALYRPYIWYSKKGVPMLYVLINKALYGMLRAALLFYRKLRADLEEMGFVVNPYDPCVANKDVRGSQCTVVWHVDDLKVSHKEEAVVTYFAKELGRRNKDKLKIKRGKVFDYLGMDVDFESCPGAMIISMIKYLNSMIEEWPEELKGSKVTPHGEHLFKIRPDDERELLHEELAAQFHRTTAQLLFLCLRARPDVQTAVSFFTTRVRSPDTDDWKKLRHCMMYLKGTLHMKRTLSADNLTNLLWWVDGSYGVHWDSKGHTGAMMSMGRGAIVNVSRKHKLNVGSSTESELVSIADVLGVMMWCKYFMEAQGYTIDNNLLYQDNKSTILLAKNGRMSAGKASRHIHNRFFLITDRIEKGDMSVEHRGTKEMWADGNTKPLQGAGFRLFRHKIMGVPLDYDDDAERIRTHPALLPKLKKAGVVPSTDLKVLAKAMGLKNQGNDPKVSSSPVTPAMVGRRSVLDDMKFGPGNRPYWEMKEGRAKCRYPDLIRALSAEQDPIRKRQLFESHRRKVEGTVGKPRARIEQGRTIASRIEHGGTRVTPQ